MKIGIHYLPKYYQTAAILSLLIFGVSSAHAEFSATELAKMCGGVSSQSFLAAKGKIAYDSNGIRIVGAEGGEVRIENEGGVLLAKIKKYSAAEYTDCLAKLRSLDLEVLKKDNQSSNLKWSRDLKGLIGTPDGNRPVVYQNVEVARVAYTLLEFSDFSCSAKMWVSQYHVPSKPNGIGGVGLKSAMIPEKKEVVNIPDGNSKYVFFHNNEFVTQGFFRQQRLAMKNGDREFAHAALNFEQNIMHKKAAGKARLSIAISVPAEGCSGKFRSIYDPPKEAISGAKRLQ